MLVTVSVFSLRRLRRRRERLVFCSAGRNVSSVLAVTSSAVVLVGSLTSGTG
ncbi:hypothetical protein [Nostoc sp.]|uniref:hypothetical protein n=1 Tax=Nostoc sp. TaxID=1180 RepID=UPI002FF5DF13